MIRLSLLAAFTFFTFSTTATASPEGENAGPVIFWDGGTLPDPLFHQYVLATFDADRDGRISKAEADAVTKIDISEFENFTPVGNQIFIWSLKGIGYFPNLKILHAIGNQFCFSELSANIKLEEFSFGGVPISITPSSSKLDLSGFKALKKLQCGSTDATTLDLSANTALTTLDCSWCSLTSLILPESAPYLTEIDCSDNGIAALDVSGLPALATLICHDNKIASLDLSKNTALQELNCHSNRFTSLDLSRNSALTFLGCSNNPLRQLDLSNLAKLEKIYLPEYDPESSLTIITNNTTKVVSELAEYLAAQEKQRLQTERLRLENEAREAAKIQTQNRAAENKRQVASYVSRNDWEAADRCATEALADMPCGDAYLYFVRAKAYYLRNLDFKNKEDEDVTAYFNAYRQEAQHTVELCSKSINMDKSAGNEAYFIRGLAYIVLKMPDSAAADFKRFMSGAPEHKGSCYYNIGIAYKNTQQWRNALDNFKLARQYSTSDEQIGKCLKKIKACQQKIDGR